MNIFNIFSGSGPVSDLPVSEHLRLLDLILDFATFPACLALCSNPVQVVPGSLTYNGVGPPAVSDRAVPLTILFFGCIPPANLETCFRVFSGSLILYIDALAPPSPLPRISVVYPVGIYSFLHVVHHVFF